MTGPRWTAWLTWIALTEAALWTLAALGPGYRHGTIAADRGLIARFFISEPSFLQAVLVNALYLHIVVGVAVTAAWLAKRHRESKASRAGTPPSDM